MVARRDDIIKQLRKDIFLMQGFKPPGNEIDSLTGLHFINQAFPNSRFPTGVIHEFFCDGAEEISASCGFITGILSSVMKKNGITVWITSSQTVFPPALKSFGIDADKIIFLHLKREKEKLWAMEEALKCDGLCSVIAEVNEISFLESRRLQLATEQSKVTGFIIRRNPKNLSTTCVTRWKIHPIHSEKTGLPGVGFPRWNVELLKVRNGKPGSWQMEWKKKKFELIQEVLFTVEEQRKIV